jgi:hypothetical protein
MAGNLIINGSIREISPKFTPWKLTVLYNFDTAKSVTESTFCYLIAHPNSNYNKKLKIVVNSIISIETIILSNFIDFEK